MSVVYMPTLNADIPHVPSLHAFAGAEHSPSTLAAINGKVSDATLIDTLDSRLSDARTPLSHKASHVSGGGDAFAGTDLLEAIVKRVQVTGPTTLLWGAVADGEFVKRSGTGLIGAVTGGGEWTDATTFIHPTNTARNVIVGAATEALAAHRLNANGSVVFNEQGSAAGDFRIEGNTEPNLLFVDAGTDRVGIATASPNAPLDVTGVGPGSVGGFPSGSLHVTSSSADVNANAVITGHNLFGGNKQLWYLGSTSGSNDNIAFINRQNGSLSLSTNSTTRFTIAADGSAVFNEQGAAVNFRIETDDEPNLFDIQGSSNRIDIFATRVNIGSEGILQLNESAAGATVNRTGQAVRLESTRSVAGGTINDDFDNVLIQRNSTLMGGVAYTATGALLKLFNVPSGVTDTSILLELVQDASSTGDLINAVLGASEIFAVRTTGLIIKTAVKLEAGISPPQITSNQNDFSPTGLATATAMILSSDAVRTITGLLAPTATDKGQILMLVNEGSFDIVLSNANVASAAANRFLFNADITVKSNQSVFLLYDSKNSRWRATGVTA